MGASRIKHLVKGTVHRRAPGPALRTGRNGSPARDATSRKLGEELVSARSTIRSQFQSLEDLHERIVTLEKELAASQHVQSMLRAELDDRARTDPPRTVRTTQDVVWSMLRGCWRRLPLKDGSRQRFKARFYSVYGRLWPDSFRYRVYRAIQDSKEAEAAAVASGAPVEVAGSDPSNGPRPWDVFVFPIIDWNFRHQRPQHLALQLAERGHRVFYFQTTFSSDADLYEPGPRKVAENVYVLSLPCLGVPPIIYEEPLSEPQLASVMHGLHIIRSRYNLGHTVSIVDHPFWLPVVEKLPNNVFVYDCMDHHGGFSNTAPFVIDYERRLLDEADLVLASSAPLASIVAGQVSRHVLIRNGTDYDHFAESPEELAIESDKPVIGYYGAIAQWFDVELFEEVARRLGHLQFYLVGDCAGADISRLRDLPNVRFTGEVTYASLPTYLHAFDVCLIPFRIVELTRCTNPVKVYEYLSAGKPVVSTALPEVELMPSIVRTASTAEGFVAKIEEALKDTSPTIVEQRREYARTNTWSLRGKRLNAEVDTLFPKVSIIVLTYNQLSFTQACLDSIKKYTDHPNFELIVVDNASSDDTPQWLKEFAVDKDWVRVILNDENLGFAAGNNLGAQAATGEYLVFLNNDTYVTRGWLGDLLAHFRRDPMIGAVGPVTNNIGNEAKLDIAYKSIDEMHRKARRYTERFRGQRFEIRVLAFFCIAIPRHIWESVGPLDEQFGMGFFEDDDYAMRIRQHGHTLQCAEDVFIHHHLSGSFGKLPDEERHKLFLRNKALWEEKWGTWQPHKYREQRDVEKAAHAAGNGT